MDAVTGRFGIGGFHCGPTVGQHRVSNFRLATASGPTGMAGLGTRSVSVRLPQRTGTVTRPSVNRLQCRSDAGNEHG